MNVEFFYESPEVTVTSLKVEGMIASSLGKDAQLESLNIVEEEW